MANLLAALVALLFLVAPVPLGSQAGPPTTVTVLLSIRDGVNVDSAGALAVFRLGLERTGSVRVVDSAEFVRIARGPGWDRAHLAVVHLRLYRLRENQTRVAIFADVLDPGSCREANGHGTAAAPDVAMRALEMLGGSVAQRMTLNPPVATRPLKRGGLTSCVGPRRQIIGGFHFGPPAAFAIAAGAVRAARQEPLRGPFAVVEPGIRAARASVGFSGIAGNLASGYSARLSYLNIYGGSRPRGGYVGAEGQLVPIAFGLRVGVFRALSARRTLVVWNVSYLL